MLSMLDVLDMASESDGEVESIAAARGCRELDAVCLSQRCDDAGRRCQLILESVAMAFCSGDSCRMEEAKRCAANLSRMSPDDVSSAAKTMRTRELPDGFASGERFAEAVMAAARGLASR